jgi:hypothetical protein
LYGAKEGGREGYRERVREREDEMESERERYTKFGEGRNNGPSNRRKCWVNGKIG